VEATVVVATYGDDPLFPQLARDRAIPSAEAQGVPVIHSHCRTLAEARNAGLAQVETEWVVHLDADDELEPGYMAAMAKGTADVRAPAVRMVSASYQGEPFVPNVYGHRHQCEAACLRWGNWLVVGACARTELLQDIGWEEFGWSEDWAIWARAYVAGASFETIRQAVYRSYRRRGSRNHVGHASVMYWHRQIEKEIWGQVAPSDPHRVG
jgi:glycosyltransferase involved in cell wall biosynthesis